MAVSDPRDELLDRILVELHLVRHVTDSARAKYASDPRSAYAECHWAYAAGQCRAIAERLLKELEQLKQTRSKTGADDSAAPG